MSLFCFCCRNRKRRTSSGTDSERNYDYNVEIHVCHKETGSCHIEQTGICEEDAAKWLISLSQGRAQTTCTNIQKPLPMQGDGNYSEYFCQGTRHKMYAKVLSVKVRSSSVF